MIDLFIADESEILGISAKGLEDHLVCFPLAGGESEASSKAEEGQHFAFPSKFGFWASRSLSASRKRLSSQNAALSHEGQTHRGLGRWPSPQEGLLMGKCLPVALRMAQYLGDRA